MQNVRILWKNCNLQNKLFFFGNNKNAKLVKVSFPILTYDFLKNGAVTHNNFNQVFFTSIKFHK